VLLPWRATAGIAAGSLAAATVAGLLPAWRAVRTQIPEAVQYE
jgi:putative ABC transport system permease protein